MNDKTPLTGAAAVQQQIEPRPVGRFNVRGITIRTPKPAPPLAETMARPPKRRPKVQIVPAVGAIRYRAGKMRAPAPRPGSSLPFVDGRPIEKVEQPPLVELVGAKATVDYFAKRNIAIGPSTDPTAFVVRAPAGRLVETERAYLDAHRPILAPHANGLPAARCTVPGPHPKGVSDEAVAVVTGGALACRFHLDEKEAIK